MPKLIKIILLVRCIQLKDYMSENEINDNKLKKEFPYFPMVEYKTRLLRDNAHIYKELTFSHYILSHLI